MPSMGILAKGAHQELPVNPAVCAMSRRHTRKKGPGDESILAAAPPPYHKYAYQSLVTTGEIIEMYSRL